MSQYTTPIESMFEFQRTAIEQGEQAMKGAVETQRNIGRMAVSGLRSQASLQRRGVELARTATTESLEAMETSMPAGASVRPLRESTEERFDRLLEAHTQLFETFERETERAIERSDDRSAESLAAFEEQFGDLLDAHEAIEERTVETIEDRAEDLQRRFETQLEDQVERTEELQERFEAGMETQLDAAEEFQKRLNAQAEAFQERLNAQAEAFEIDGDSAA